MYYINDITIPSTVEYEGELYSVTSIGKYAFVDNQSAKIEFGNELQMLDDHAMEVIENLLQQLCLSGKSMSSGSFCPECGASVSGKFCSSCGKKLS